MAIGGQTRAAAFYGTHYSRAASFRYTVAAADRDADGISVAANAISLDGGSITSYDGSTDAVLEHAAVADDAGRKVNGSQATAPAVSGVSITSRRRGGTTYVRGESIVVEVRFRFSEPVTVTGRPSLALRVGAATRTAGMSAQPMPDTIAFAYTLRSGDDAGEGIGMPANTLRLNGGSIRDGVGNDSVLNTSEVLPSVRQAADPGVRIGCKQPAVSAARATLQAASAGGNGGGGLDSYDFELTLELDENRDGGVRPVELGCVALAAPDRQFSYSITRGDASRFAVGAADGSLRYIGSGENAEQTPEYLLRVTATPHDSGAALHLAVRVAIVDADDPVAVVLSTMQPYLGEEVTAQPHRPGRRRP